MFFGFFEENSQLVFEDQKDVPGWSGWLCLSTKKAPPSFPSKVEYMRPIHYPATENATIEEVLRRSKNPVKKRNKSILS